MTENLIETEVARFLANPPPGVLCLRGKWGVGKTFGWNAMLQSAKAADALTAKSYSYVSLFGIAGIDQLRGAIFENTIPRKDIGVRPSLETLESSFAGAQTFFRRALSHVPSIPFFSHAGAAIQALSFLSVSDALICIDDIERKGSNLSFRDVLGLVSYLKEQRGCKVVIILNEEELVQSDKDEFDKYNEKVIDISLHFAPSATDCIRIALRGPTDLTTKQLEKYCALLGISNIRVIKQIERLAKRATELLASREPLIKQQAIQTLTLLGWLEYTHQEKFLAYILERRSKDWFGLEDKASDEERQFGTVLDEYEFTVLDEFDLALLDGIKSGFFDEPRLQAEAAALEKKIQGIKAEESFESAWRKYHDSFANDEQQVLDEIFSAFKKNVHAVTPLNLSGTVKLLKDLGRAEQAQDAIKFYMSQRTEEREFFNLDAYAFAGDVTDTDVRSAFDQKFASFTDDRSPVEVLLQISKNDGWSRRDIGLLTRVTEDQFIDIFRSSSGADLSRIVRASLIFSKMQGADEDMRSISAQATAALVRIGGESAINRRRIKKYGIEIGD